MPGRTLLRAKSEKDRERCPYPVEYRYVEVAEQFQRLIVNFLTLEEPSRHDFLSCSRSCLALRRVSCRGRPPTWGVIGAVCCHAWSHTTSIGKYYIFLPFPCRMYSNRLADVRCELLFQDQSSGVEHHFVWIIVWSDINSNRFLMN